MITNEAIISRLEPILGDKMKDLITYPAYAKAFEGLSHDGIVIYSFFKMTVIYASLHKVDMDTAAREVNRDIEYLETTVRQAGKIPPIINVGNPFSEEG